MAELQTNRWQAGENDFAVRLELNDVEGFFSKKLTIEPGTRALFLERGRMIGEVPPGEYTLLAWESVEGEAYYNPEFLKSYGEQGTVLRVSEGERKSLRLTVVPALEDQQ